MKKIVNWTRQHSNGIKFTFYKLMLNFSDVSVILLKLKIKFSQLTTIKKHVLDHNFNDEVTIPHVLAQLLDKKVHFNVTFFGEFNDQPEVASWYGRKIIAVDKQAKDSDWLTLKIKMSELTYYQQKNWQESFVSVKQAASHKLFGLLITAKSKNGKTIRSYMKDKFTANYVEQFIELPLELHRPELILRR